MNDNVAILKERLATYKEPKNPSKTEKWKLEKDLTKCTVREMQYMKKAGVTVSELMEEGLNRGQVAHILYGYKHVNIEQLRSSGTKAISWHDVWKDEERLLHTLLSKCYCKQRNDDLFVFVRDPFTFDVMRKSRREKDIERLLLNKFGISLSVTLVFDGETSIDRIVVRA